MPKYRVAETCQVCNLKTKTEGKPSAVKWAT